MLTVEIRKESLEKGQNKTWEYYVLNLCFDHISRKLDGSDRNNVPRKWAYLKFHDWASHHRGGKGEIWGV